MNELQKGFFVIVISLIMNSQVSAQEYQVDFDALVIGINYKVSIENGWETEGKLISNDSGSIVIKSYLKIFTIEKKEIVDIIDLSPNPNPKTSIPHILNIDKSLKAKRLFISAGTGVNFAGASVKDEYFSGVDFQLSLTKIVTDNYAIRGNFEFSQSPAKVREYVYSYDGRESYSKYEGGDLNNYSFKFDFLLGGLKMTSKLNAYAIMGTGLNFVHQSEVANTYSYQLYNKLTNTYYQYTNSNKYTPDSYTEIPLEFGGGIGYKLSDKIRIYSEAQYRFPFMYAGGYGLFFNNNIEKGNPSLKIGVQMEL